MGKRTCVNVSTCQGLIAGETRRDLLQVGSKESAIGGWEEEGMITDRVPPDGIYAVRCNWQNVVWQGHVEHEALTGDHPQDER